MGKKHKKTTAAADAVAAAQVAEAAKPAPAPVVAAAPKQNANALADMFAQSSVLFAKKTSYVQNGGAAPKKQSHQAEQVKMAAEAAELAASVVAAGGGKRKRSKKTNETVENEESNDEETGVKKEKKQKKSSKTEEDEDEDESVKPEKKQKKKKHKKLAKEAAEAAAAAGESADSATAAAEPTEEAKSTATDDEKTQRTVFVGNVSLDATQKDIKTFFSTCGKVENVRLRFMPLAGCAVDQAGNQKLMMKVCANKKILNDSKDNCNAYVTFAEQASVAKALALNGATFMLMKIRVDHENPVVDPKRSVFVGNVGFNVSDEKVRKFFEKRLKSDEEPNPVENVRIIRDRASGVGKGFGYVLLKNATLAGKALSLHETSLDSRPIRVQVCGKRFKNKKGEDDDKKSKHEGVRASAGAKARVALKRKASGKPLPEQTTQPKKKLAASPASGSSMKPKPKHVERKAFQASSKDAAGGAKRVFKKAPGGKDGKGKFSGKKSSSTPKPKVKKPKHAARKARQAAEASAAGGK